MTDMRAFLTQRGWVEQDIPGLYCHPLKANGSELTIMQAFAVEGRQIAEANGIDARLPGIPIREVVRGMIR